MLAPFPLQGASVLFDPGWLAADQADALFAALRAEVCWEVHRIRMFGREVDSPRLSSWIGDPGSSYAYSGARFEPRPWPPALIAVRERLEKSTGESFNSVLANLYRDQADAMGWHSDDEPELGPQPVIASLSLGASRRFVLRNRADVTRQLALDLGHGSLLLMRGQTQENYRHSLPRTRRKTGPRINLTFRRILPEVEQSVRGRRR